MTLDFLIRYLRYQRAISEIKKLERVYGANPLRVLDAGGGGGAFAHALRKRGHEVTVCDKEGTPAVNLEQGIPFPDRSFDLAVSLAVVEHLNNWRLLLDELRRVSDHAMGTTPSLRGKPLLEWLAAHGLVNPGHIADHKHYLSPLELDEAGYQCRTFAFALNQIFNWHRPAIPRECAPKLSVVIPCYNEHATIAELLTRVRRAWPGPLEVICVDDCSTDGSREILKKCRGTLLDTLVLHEQNTGKGSALRSGFALATGELVVIQDADLEYDPAALVMLAAPILEGRADVVYGSRFLGCRFRESCHFHVAVNLFLTRVCNLVTGLDLTDMETCQKMFKREQLSRVHLVENRFGFEPEVTIKLSSLGARFMEIPIGYQRRGRHEGKKIGWRDGAAALYCVARHGLTRSQMESTLKGMGHSLLPLLLVLLLFCLTNGPASSLLILGASGNEQAVLSAQSAFTVSPSGDGSYRDINATVSWMRRQGIETFGCVVPWLGAAAPDSIGPESARLLHRMALAQFVCLQAVAAGYPEAVPHDSAEIALSHAEYGIPEGWSAAARFGSVIVARRKRP
jgi:SAM-dependent methyltransferase